MAFKILSLVLILLTFRLDLIWRKDKILNIVGYLNKLTRTYEITTGRLGGMKGIYALSTIYKSLFGNPIESNHYFSSKTLKSHLIIFLLKKFHSVAKEKTLPNKFFLATFLGRKK